MLSTKDVKINGYPPIEVILAHYDAIPVLIRALAQNPTALAHWDNARNVGVTSKPLVPVTPKACRVFETNEE